VDPCNITCSRLRLKTFSLALMQGMCTVLHNDFASGVAAAIAAVWKLQSGDEENRRLERAMENVSGKKRCCK